MSINTLKLASRSLEPLSKIIAVNLDELIEHLSNTRDKKNSLH